MSFEGVKGEEKGLVGLGGGPPIPASTVVSSRLIAIPSADGASMPRGHGPPRAWVVPRVRSPFAPFAAAPAEGPLGTAIPRLFRRQDVRTRHTARAKV